MKTQLIENRYPLLSFNFVTAYVITMRPYLMFVSGITGIAGLSFGELSFVSIVFLFSAAFLSYGFGQALTDCFQIDTDSISSPYRPLTQGLVSRSHILFVSITGLAYCVLIYTLFNPVNLILGIISGFGLATYTPFKRKWWGGPFYNSWIVGLLFTMSFLSSASFLPAFHSNRLILSLCAVFFGYANFVLSGYFKDISADRATGYNTLPVVFGRKTSAVISDVLAFLTLAFALASMLTIFNGKNLGSIKLISFLFLAVSVIISAIAQVRLHLVKKDEEAHKSISLVVHVYILSLSAIAAANKPEWSLFLFAFYLVYLFVLKIRPAKNQI